MAVIGTFGSFTAARLGIFASQSAMNAVGNNIANINTEGYTRQRMDLVSLYSYGGIRYANRYNLNIGYGVLVDSVSQLRDPFLDIRYRNENAKAGAYEEKLDCLQQLSQVLDEVGKGNDEFGIVERQFNEFLKMLQNLNGKVGSGEYDTTVRGSAWSLTNLLNDYAKAMETLADNKLGELKKDVETVNTLLTEIRDLSVQIRNADIAGDNALELRDARNVCIDKLSAYMKIDVTYDLEKIDEFNTVERINISIAGSESPYGGPIKLIQGIYGAQISMNEYTAMRNPEFDPDVSIDDPDYATKASRYLYIDEDGNRVLTNYALNPNYDPTAPASSPNSHQYMLYDPLTGTYKFLDLDEDEVAAGRPPVATQVPNALEGDETNRLWMTVEPLVDAKGKYMRDEYHKEIISPVDLSDTVLYGSLQSLREFLTEKGEFSSDDDILFDSNAAQKRGIQYYQRALDALARKFADAFNKANQLNFEDVSTAYKTAEVDDPNNPGTKITAFVDEFGNPIEDKDGNIITPEYFDNLATDMAELEALRAQIANGTPAQPAIPDVGELTTRKAELEAEVAELEKTEPMDRETEAQIAAKKKEIIQLEGQIRATDRTTTAEIQARIKDLEKEIADESLDAYDAMEVLRTEGVLTDLWSFYKGGVLFSNNGDTNDPKDITAKNITISKDWESHAIQILNTKIADGLDHSTADDNIYHMIELMSEDMDYFPNEIVDNAMQNGEKRYFTGSFQERLADMNSILGVETDTTALQYNNYTLMTLSLENSRQSVSGVDLNDEATNMMMFQKSYSAACQLITTIDSMLDKLINGTLR